MLSPLTVKTHLSRILTKTDARDRAQLVVLAYETGLVRPGGQGTPPGGRRPPPGTGLPPPVTRAPR